MPLPDDTWWFANDGNEPITHDWTNDLQRAVDCIKANQADGTFPPPVGTALPWGGGRMLYFQDDDGIADHGDLTVSSDLDFQNRIIVVWEAYAQDAANKIPGGGAAPINGSAPVLSWSFQGSRMMWSGTGLTAGNPPAAPGTGQYLAWQNHQDAAAPTVSGFLYVATGTKALMFRNESGATLYCVFLVWVSDQMPART